MSYFKEINIQGYRSSDQTYQPIRLDKATNTLQTMEYEHREIHAGSHFYLQGYLEFGAASTVDLAIITPDTTKWAHMTFSFETTGETLFQIYEVSDFDGDGGVVTPLNNNRNSTNASVLTITTDPTVNSYGNLIGASLVGVTTNPTKSSGGLVARNNELILKQNTKYIFKFTSNSANNNISYAAEWYEHTDIA